MSETQSKVVVITGASSGIGEAIALRLSAKGAKVILGARNPAPLQALAERIQRAGGTAGFAPTNVAKRQDLLNLVNLAVQQHGRLDVLVNNAGVSRLSRLDEVRVEEWDEMIDVNLRGVLYGLAAALPIFKLQGFGHVVNIISTSGLRIVPQQAVYAATKNAVRTLSEALRQESGANLRVTGISPGFVKTNIAESITDPAAKAAIIEKMDRIAITPDAIARAVAFAIDQPDDVDVNDIVVRPTAQD